jgi:hypothetical protein
MAQGNKPAYAVYVTREGRDGKTFYTRIGSAWRVGNDGVAVKFDALPTNGECVLFPPKEEDRP